ncbi:glycogen synthase [Haploplasma axanthum]|uniref:Glycogen synthase n=1 Tax=Haploplasma axanthum TaxID=29552 RepID=A0A449BFI6_HAPAX|nr:glycogen/starch synthase [Haploplasma axanthum]VEU81070.1 Glycogen synthase 1 [Haploplasma axanthum]
MKVLFCSPEVYPFSKIGGLADFSAALPSSLNHMGNTVYVVSPYYERVKREYGKDMEFVGEREIKIGDEIQIAKYYRTTYNDVRYFFVSHEYFNRKYFFNHSDDVQRFLFFNLAILELIPLISFYPDLIHVNDWATSLVPYFLSTIYSTNSEYEHIKTLLTIHNLEKQGAFSRDFESFFGNRNFTYIHLNNVNFLKTGIMRSSKINTVSKSYRSEILTKFFGFSLDGALKSRQFELYGIQNGLDFNLYNPKTDKYIFKNYDISSHKDGKRINKEKLLKEIGFEDNNKMVLTFISRFAKEKGVALINEVIEKYLKDDRFYFLVIGEGDINYEDHFFKLVDTYPKNIHFVHGHNHETSQKFYAASDLLLMPSLYEASGLNQMIAMRYGTLPLVRETGGLKDTVIPYDEVTKIGTGFTFENFDDEELRDAIDKAVDIYYNKPKTWDNIVENAMAIDNNIEKMAKEYNELYKDIIKN